MAGAPGPSAGKPPADILFTVTGSRALLTADTLTLRGVAPVALHTTSGQGAGATPIGAHGPSAAAEVLEPKWNLNVVSLQCHILLCRAGGMWHGCLYWSDHFGHWCAVL